MLQDSVNRWWESLLMFFGPKSKENTGSSHQDKNIKYKLREKGNEELRQDFFNKYVPNIWALGLTIPDETIYYDEEKQEWVYQEPDWDRFKEIVTGHGPRSQERLDLRRTSYEHTRWVRDALGTVQDTAAV
jgi:ring-1,2-phenylacetyl-CoA epoxidase subunit PaaA